MKLTILGATGGVGRHLVGQALAGGHDVTAVVRRPEALPPAATPVVGDLTRLRAEDLERAVAGADAVLSAVGARSRPEAGVATIATRAVLDAMVGTGTRRIVVVSAAPVGTVASPGRPHPPRHDPGDDLLARLVLTPLVRRVFARAYADLATMEDVLRTSDRDWTAVRPPRLTDGPARGTVRTAIDATVPHGRSVSRADLAALLLAVVGRAETVGHTVGVAG